MQGILQAIHSRAEAGFTGIKPDLNADGPTRVEDSPDTQALEDGDRPSGGFQHDGGCQRLCQEPGIPVNVHQSLLQVQSKSNRIVCHMKRHLCPTARLSACINSPS